MNEFLFKPNVKSKVRLLQWITSCYFPAIEFKHKHRYRFIKRTWIRGDIFITVSLVI